MSPVVAEDEKLEPCGGLFEKDVVGVSELPAAFPILIADGCVEIPLKEAVENDLHSAGANAS